jgi:hypothetical protein
MLYQSLHHFECFRGLELQLTRRYETDNPHETTLYTSHNFAFSLRITLTLAGKFYTLTTGANERRWEKMKDKLHTVVDSFKLFNV